MVTVNIHDAKTQLSKLIEAVENGEEVVIARAHKPVAQLVLFRRQPLKLGDWDLGLKVASDWDTSEINDAIETLFDDSATD